MDSLFKKLELSETADEILVLNEPKGFDEALETLKNVDIKRSLIQVSKIDFAILFITDKKQIENRIDTVYPKLAEDAALWFALPTKASSDYNPEIFNRSSWEILGDYNLKPVAQVPLNIDWTAVRFRKIHFIKAMWNSTFSFKKPETDKNQKV